jgi:trans-aconitate methyltransferase
VTDTQSNLDRLEELTRGFRATQATYVVAKLGLADALAAGPATAAELARKANVNAEALARVLRFAAFCDLVREVPGDRFELTGVGNLLRAGVPGSLKAHAIMVGEQHYTAWGSLIYSVRTGKPAFDHVFGSPFFDYMAKDPDAQATFDAAMSSGTDLYLASLADVYDFRGRTLIDVGGGNGSLSAIILKRHPQVEAVIYDQPQVLEAADRYLTDAGVRERCRLVPGNFFESVPEGGDVYFLSNIVHDWDDERALQILKNCRTAMNPSAVLLLLEAVMPEHGTPPEAAMYDVNMMVLLTGKERTQTQFESLLRAAGLRLDKVTPVSKTESLIEARPR